MKNYNVSIDTKGGESFASTFTVNANNIKEARAKAQLHKRREFRGAGIVRVSLSK